MTTSPSGHSIRERLDELYRRLQSAPAPTTAEAALEQICRILDEVEDELSGVPKSDPPPGPAESDGRMYPPYDDNILRRDNGEIVASTRGHLMEIGADGTVVIRNRYTQSVEFQK